MEAQSESQREPFDDEHLSSVERQAKAMLSIAEALRTLPVDRRALVFRAASILSIGKDITTER